MFQCHSLPVAVKSLLHFAPKHCFPSSRYLLSSPPPLPRHRNMAYQNTYFPHINRLEMPRISHSRFLTLPIRAKKRSPAFRRQTLLFYTRNLMIISLCLLYLQISFSNRLLPAKFFINSTSTFTSPMSQYPRNSITIPSTIPILTMPFVIFASAWSGIL